MQLLIDCTQRAVLSRRGQPGKLASIEAEWLELLVLVTDNPRMQYVLARHWILLSASRSRLVPQLVALIDAMKRIPNLSERFSIEFVDVSLLFGQLIEALPFVQQVYIYYSFCFSKFC